MSEQRLILGLTGKTGAGKSTVSHYLARLGAAVFDADLLVRELEQTDSVLIAKLKASFGEDIYKSGELDRPLLARRAFSDEASTELLNKIVHPVVTERLRTLSEEAFASGKSVVVYDAAALIESGEDRKCDFVAVVTAPEEIRLKRIIGRDGISEEAARLRMSAQREDSFYEARADFIIRNYNPYSLDSELAPLTDALGL